MTPSCPVVDVGLPATLPLDAFQPVARAARRRATIGRKNDMPGHGVDVGLLDFGEDQAVVGLKPISDHVSATEMSSLGLLSLPDVAARPVVRAFWPGDVDGFPTQLPLWPEFTGLAIQEPAGDCTKTKKYVRHSKQNMTDEQKTEVDHRGLAGQRPKAISRDMGVTFKQVTSRLYKSAISRFRKNGDIAYVDHYDPALAEDNIVRLRLERRSITLQSFRGCSGLFLDEKKEW